MNVEAIRVFLLDNYDSFTWNLAQYLMELGAQVTVARNDERSVPAILGAGDDALVISPGPGRPEDAGVTLELLRAAAGRMPVLGVCLGHQAMAAAYGGSIVPAPTLMHGKTSPILHDGRGLFEGLPLPFEATRYHSLVVDEGSLPAGFTVTARTPEGVIMGIRDPGRLFEGVQFHPESILTREGKSLLANFLRWVERWKHTISVRS